MNNPEPDAHVPRQPLAEQVDVAAYRQLEAALREAENRLALAQRVARVGFWTLDLHTNQLTWSEEVYRIIGRSPDQFAATLEAFYQVVHPEDLPEMRERTRQALSGGPPYRMDHRILLPDGSVRFVHERGEVIRDERGNPISMFGTVQDITERKQAEDQLRYRLAIEELVARVSSRLVNVMPEQLDAEILHALEAVGTFVGIDHCYLDLYAPDGQTLERSLEWCAAGLQAHAARVHGLPLEPLHWAMERLRRGEPLDVPCVDDLPPEASAEKQLWQALGYQALLAIPLVLDHKLAGMIGLAREHSTESKHWAEEDVRLLSLIGGVLTSAIARTRTEVALRESEERLQLVLDGSNDGFWDWNIVTGEVKHSPRYAEMLGYRPEELEPHLRAWESLVHPEDRQRVLQALRDHWEGRVPQYESEQRMRTRSGEWKWILDRGKVVARDAEGNPVRMAGTHTDISQRRQAEEALRESEEKYRALAENLTDAVMRFDRQFTCVYANRAAGAMLNVPPAALIGRKIEELGLPDVPAHNLAESVVRVFETGKPHRTELDIELGKAHKSYDSRMIPEFDAQGQVVTVLNTVRDVTEVRHLENQLLQAQKMEAVGQLAGGIAHDFNNLLTGILGYANLLKLESMPGSPVHEAAKTIERAAERAAELTKQLLGFARRGKHQNIALDVHQTIQEVITLLSRTVDKNISITQRLRAYQSSVMGDPNQMQQMLLNLAVNARDAMPGGGELTFETDSVHLDEEYCRTHLGATPGDYVLIAVTDTGHGIAREHLGRIFEPFFTTKQPGQGTGMGLAMVYGIVKNHGGYIQVYSEVGHGTTFKVYLPLAERVSLPAESRDNKITRGSGRILLIDDEQVVQDVASHMLNMLGYQVVTVSSGAEALDYYRAHHNEIDAVIVDMIMPGMGGHECFRELKRINPAVKAILSTGYGLNEKVQSLMDEGILEFVQKPYQLSQLSEAVKRVLAG